MLHLAIARGDIALVRQLCSKSSTNVNKEADGITPLMLSLHGQIDIEIFRVLLNHPRLDVNVTAKGKITALMLAILLSSDKSIKTTMQQRIELLAIHPKCKLGLRNEDGLTALELAAHQENVAAVKCLVRGDRVKQYAMEDILSASVLTFKSGNDELIHALLDNIPEEARTLLLLAIRSKLSHFHRYRT